jgi:hypothetical protein
MTARPTESPSLAHPQAIRTSPAHSYSAYQYRIAHPEPAAPHRPNPAKPRLNTRRAAHTWGRTADRRQVSQVIDSAALKTSEGDGTRTRNHRIDSEPKSLGFFSVFPEE